MGSDGARQRLVGTLMWGLLLAIALASGLGQDVRAEGAASSPALPTVNAPAVGTPATATEPQQDRVTASVNPAQTVRLAGKLPAWVSPARVQGEPSPGLRLDHLTILLTRSAAREQAFRQLLDDQQNPASPAYHHWLTPQQLGEQYGVSDHDIAAVKSWLEAASLQVEQVSNSRTVISFGGSVEAVEAAFSVRFHRYVLSAGDAAAGTPLTRLSISAAPRVPAALAPVIEAIGGLSQIPVHPYGRAQVRPMPKQTTPARPQFSNCDSAGTCEHFITPSDFATIFDLAGPLFEARQAGAGQRIAIIGRSRVDPDDISNFGQAVGEGVSLLPNVLIPPSGIEPGTTNNSDQLEATIDVIRAFGTAPGAAQDLVVSAGSQTVDGIYQASLYNVETVLDPVMNLSFGACETDAGAPGVMLFDNLFSQAAAEGISIFVSSGDAGAAGCDKNNATPPLVQVMSPNFLCSSTYVTCVGGTELNDTADPAQYWGTTNSSFLASALSYIPEGGWNEPTFTDSNGATAFQASSSGGGVSSLIAKPAWQTGTGVPADGFRDTPDVSFPAAAHDGYFACSAFIGADCSQGYFAYVFGTSAAAPAMAGIAAILNQQRTTPVGNLNPVLYAVAGTPGQAAFHDTTVASSGVVGCSLATPSMCNNSTPSPTGLAGGLAGYAVTDGYDQVTGLGSLEVRNFFTAAAPPLLMPTVTPDQNVIQVTTSQTFPLHATVAGSGPVPTGTVTWSFGPGLQLGPAVLLVNGVGTLPAAQIPVVGIYFLGVRYSGDANYAATGPENQAQPEVMVTGGAASFLPTVQVTASPANVYLQQPAVFTATVQGSGPVPTGTVQFYSPAGPPLGAAVPLVNGVASSVSQVFLQPVDGGIEALYSGDAVYGGGLGYLSVSLVSAPGPSFQIGAAGLTLMAGQATGNSTVVTVASENYNDTITFTCLVTRVGVAAVTDPPVCTLSTPATLTLSPTTSSGSLTATLSTVAPSVKAAVADRVGAPATEHGRGARPFGEEAIAAAGLLCLVLRRSGKGWVSFRTLLLPGLLLGVIAGAMTACGGGNSASTPPLSPIIPGTTVGSYNVTVTGSSRTFTSQASFLLTVK